MATDVDFGGDLDFEKIWETQIRELKIGETILWNS